MKPPGATAQQLPGSDGPTSSSGFVAPIFQTGALFGRYEIMRRIGSGGMAEVYEAVHVGLKKRVAIKVIRREMAEQAGHRARFLREGEAAARIRHPNVVDITDVGVLDNLPYLVMEYLEGETLRDVLKRDGRVAVEQLANLMLPVVAAVAAGHDQGVIHRDLKPDNVFLATDGVRRTQPKLLDFGVSGFVEDLGKNLTLDTNVFGTPHYMSPEQARGDKNITQRVDQYALGVILYEATTGRLPRERDSLFELIHAVAHESCDPPRMHNPELPEAFESLIVKSMQSNPNDRFGSVRELGAALLPFGTERAREYWSPEFVGGGPSTVRRASDPPTALPYSSGSLPPPRVDEKLITQPLPDVRRGGRLFGTFAAIALVGGGIAAGVVWGPAFVRGVRGPAHSSHGPDRFVVSVEVEPANARIELDGIGVAQGTFSTELERDGTTHELRVTADGHSARTITFRDAPPPPIVRLTPLASPIATAATSPAASTPAQTPIVPESHNARGGRRGGTRSARRGGAPVASAQAVDAQPVAVQQTETATPAQAPAQTAPPPQQHRGNEWPRVRSTDNRDPWAH